MSDLYKMFETDKNLETEGIWYSFDKDTKFLLARAGGSNIRFAKILENKTRPYRRQIDNGTIDTEFGNSLLIEAFAEAVILGWTGVKAKGKNGKEMKYSVENAVKLLTDLPDLFAELREEAARAANFRNEEIEEDVGN